MDNFGRNFRFFVSFAVVHVCEDVCFKESEIDEAVESFCCTVLVDF